MIKESIPSGAKKHATPEHVEFWWTKWKGREPVLNIDEKVSLLLSRMTESKKNRIALTRLFERRPHPVCFDKFKESTRIDICRGLVEVANLKALTTSGRLHKNIKFGLVIYLETQYNFYR